MSRRRRKGLSPSLFPFLAVLVCTLGTLILLLALVAQNAEQSAQQRVDAEAQNASALTEVAQLEAEELIAYRDRQTAALDSQRGELAHLEDHLRRLREELAALKNETEIAEEDSSSLTRSDALRNEIRELDRKLAETYAELEELEDETSSRPPRVVIVPYRGSNGTQRRPIYVECTDEAIVLQPEGVRITAANLSGSLGPGNPMDAALRTIRQHWQTIDPNAPPPYPLLLIRPDGVHAYAACRMAMDAWDDQFGYELVPADMELAFPAADTELKDKLVATIDEATRRSLSRLAGGPPRENRFAQGVQPNSLRPGIGQGAYGGEANETGAGADPRQGLPDRVAGTRNGSNFGTGSGPGSNAYSLSANETGSAASGPGQDTTLPPRLIGDGMNGSPGSPVAGSASSNQSRALTADPSSNTGLPVGNRVDPNGIPTGASSTGTALSGVPGNELAAANAARQNPLSNRDAIAAGTNALSPGSPNGNTPGAPSAEPGGSPSSNLQSGNGSASPDNAVTTSSGSPMAQQGAQQAQGSLQASSGGSGSSSAMGGQKSVSNGSAGPSMPNRTPPQTFSEALEQRSRLQAEQLPKTRPPKLPNLSSANNWALPESMRSHRGPTVVREIRMDCTLQEFIVYANRESPPIRIPIRNGLVNQAVADLAKVLHDMVSEWGPVMRGGQWEPVLSVRVAPQAESRFDQLEMLLRNSGVRLERRSQR